MGKLGSGQGRGPRYWERKPRKRKGHEVGDFHRLCRFTSICLGQETAGVLVALGGTPLAEPQSGDK